MPPAHATVFQGRPDPKDCPAAKGTGHQISAVHEAQVPLCAMAVSGEQQPLSKGRSETQTSQAFVPMVLTNYRRPKRAE